ncbi:CCA tRNA nucleotidyltransferase [Sphingosinicella sp. BN140058]|uniref:CCA tRNA nucleotidyltransferase n=1 Tax=Sphingosinicella sp. BN140058 TaxID=1892855 RepID=UPI0010137A46|nr:CCA tRNA nucleotidyltransferase [Sphingosinicella sp. BN140058]QAY76575.1 CCA tRNA nucleotidyltransferase [Sphingosinicella sp. BN140058]
MKLPAEAPSAGMRRLLDALGSKQGQTRYVGGWVRDTLLGLPVSDIDLATRHRPEEVIALLRTAGIKAVPTGLAHGTITAVVESRPVEVTTLRRDVATDGRRATIAYTDDWAEDAARRDFTINALSADPESGEVHDYFGGKADLEAGVVRFIGDPLTRIAEDHLRILRFFRFHARFGRGPADAAALDACTMRANDLMALSRERIADEITKLLALAAPSGAIRLMIERGILRPVLPEITDVAPLERLIAREAEAGIPGDPLRRFAALLPADADVAGAVGTRLRLSNKAVKRLVCAASRTADPESVPAVLAYRIGREEAIDRLLLSDAEPAAAAGLLDWDRPQLRISGGTLIRMGLQAGPIVAATMEDLKRRWSAAGFPGDPHEQTRLAEAAVAQALRETQ